VNVGRMCEQAAVYVARVRVQAARRSRPFPIEPVKQATQIISARTLPMREKIVGGVPELL